MISKERFREEAKAAYTCWLGDENFTLDCEDYIADTLHALHAEHMEELARGRGSVPNDAARLSSVKETARAIWAAYFVSGDMPMTQWYSGGKDVERIKADTNAVVNLADELESAFERRYGGKP